MRIKGLIVLTLLALPLAIFATRRVDAQGGGEFKNLQVLPKNISKAELRDIMKAQSKALGVDCDFCHKVPDMASDELKTKKFARTMFQMTNDINSRYLKITKLDDPDRVTCATCHRGHEVPPPATMLIGIK